MIKKIVVKIGTSTLTYENGKTNLRRMEKLASVLSDIQNSGIQVVLVTSGAIGVGVQKIGLPEKPGDTSGRQAAASVGQTELMFMYDKFFGEYNQIISQLLITKDDMEDRKKRTNLINTFNKLFNYGIIPIVNENDSISTDEIEFGDNDTLSAYTASIINADMLVIMTDIDGLYDTNPKENPNAKLIPVIENFSDGLYASAGGAGSNRGTGGMITKLRAAKIAVENHIDVVIMNGEKPEKIYSVLDGKPTGTFFKGKSNND